MEQKYREQLERFARIRTPAWKAGQANDTHEEICLVYCQIRNLAKDILNRYEQFDEQNRSKLIGLLARAEELDNELLEGFVNSKR